jgi:hypothetical protein
MWVGIVRASMGLLLCWFLKTKGGDRGGLCLPGCVGPAVWPGDGTAVQIRAPSGVWRVWGVGL